MKTRMHFFAVALTLISITCPFPAIAGSPVQDQFNDDKILASALGDISKMGREEIESLISFHVACSISDRSDINKSSCEKEQSIFQMKYSRGRSIDKILYAFVILRQYIELPKNQRISEPSENEEMSKLIRRYVDVKRRLSDAITKRFQTLAKLS